MRRVVAVASLFLFVIPLLVGFAADAVAGQPQPSFKLDLKLVDAAAGQNLTGPPSGPVPLSLADSIAVALKNNLDITIEGYNPRLREQDLIASEAVFDPSAFFELTRTDRRFPASTSFFASGANTTDTWDFNTGVRQTLPTGGTYELRFNNETIHPADALTGSTRAWASRPVLTLTQPLLRNFGFEANETNIRLATNNRSIAQEQLRLRVSNVTIQTYNAYVELIYAYEFLEVQRRSLQLARDLVTLNTARVRAGVAAPVEVTQAEAQQAAQVQNVILAEKAVQDAQDNLKVILNLPTSGGSWVQEIRPTYTLTFQPQTVSLDAAIQAGLENRYEYKSAKLDIQNKELSLRLARNQLLPDLSMTGSVSTSGIGSSYGSDLQGVRSGDFVSYQVGLILTVPLGNRAANANYNKANLTLEQSKASLKQLELQIVQQVREGVRRVDANAKRVDATRAATVLAAEQLRVEQRRLEAGVSTTFNVLQFQTQLATAQANEIRAVADYYEALANLDSVRGTVLQTYKIEM
jgi:outer membrane protein TolC